MQTENDFIKKSNSYDPLFIIDGTNKCYQSSKSNYIIPFAYYSEKQFVYNSVKKIDENDRVSIKKYTDDFDEILKVLRLKRTGYELFYNVSNLCRAILERAFKGKSFEELDDFENEKLQFLKAGQYITYNNNETTTKNTTTYDVNSFYGYVLKSSSFAFNFGKGQTRMIDEITNLYENQYFHINILDNNTLPFYMKTDKKNLWVTNWDILIFNECGAKYELNKDFTFNNYFYDKSNSARNSFLEKHIEPIYKLKPTNSLVKNVLSKIIGVMFTKKLLTKHFDEFIEEDDVRIKGLTLTNMEVDLNGNDVFYYSSSHADINQHNIARNKPFLFAFIKYKFLYLIKPVIQNKIPFYRIYCDSITCEKNEYMDALVNDKCGGFKIENKIFNGQVGNFENTHNFIPKNL